MRRNHAPLALAVLLLAAVAACGRLDVDSEPGNFWNNACAEAPCGWEQLAGSLGHAPTWSETDYAYTFEAPGTKLTRRVDRRGCQQIEILGDIEASAELTLQLDLNEDDIVDFTAVLPASHWQPTALRVNGPIGELGMRMTIEKRGTGKAAIARLRMSADPCASAQPPVPPTTFADGSVCGRCAVAGRGERAGGRCGRLLATGRAVGSVGDRLGRLAAAHRGNRGELRDGGCDQR